MAAKYTDAKELLKQNHMSVTASRCAMIDLFLNSTQGAVRHSDIESELKNIDRVTIYRNLQAFKEKGIIHNIPSTDGAALYALCHSGCTDGHHLDNHVHFSCASCGSTQCLDHISVPEVSLPENFQADKIEMVITGICPKCRVN
ncbi:Fur family transcriptional regulator [Polluticaenibacter yanchengensis]|uniref:Transcriptional repressor n=1 Tax=Polluticaenibacter yanchengensis TaxID=3014562 RepID=A0ABT4UGX9_9BACT|nr:transcriptional repressor [Chitinophagaceae bacterium LY-5]